MRAAAKYPAYLETDLVLRDGTTVHVRPVRPEDEPRVLAFLRSLSEESRVYRFFAALGEEALAEEARRMCDVDYEGRMALVATAGPEERVVAHGMYTLRGPGRAEVAVVVADAYQGKGLGTLLLGQLAEIAAVRGIEMFEAEVLPENHRMIRVLRDLGFPVEVRAGRGELEVTFPTRFTPEAVERFEQRERIAAANALRAILQPRSVAVIGASRDRESIPGRLFWNLLAYGFTGTVYPVNPRTPVVQGVPSYPSVEAIPEAVDLAVVVVPAEHVVDVAQQCARKGVRALVVISSGFAEAGAEGARRQAELLRICRESGMRLVGPNCMGVVNTHPEVRLLATFAPKGPPRGHVGFMSQSGGLGLAIMEYAAQVGLGLSSFVSVGNKADISGNDLLQYWEEDPDTHVILLYLESFGNPRKFARIARRVSRRKPIVAAKSGRSSAGGRAVASHTGALVAGADAVVDALFAQAGVIRTDTLEEMFDVAVLLAHQPPPQGRNVAILTNVGGPGILCADACEGQGLRVCELPQATQRRLRAVLPPHAAVSNPVDMTAAARPEHYREAMRILGEEPELHALIVIFSPPVAIPASEVARAIREGAAQVRDAKPVLVVFMTAEQIPETFVQGEPRLPVYPFPERAAIALARAARYGEWRNRPIPSYSPPAGIRREEAMAEVARALAEGKGWLDPDQVRRVLAFYGLPVLDQHVVATPQEAAEIAEAMGGEVALKAVAPGLIHKSEVGGVRLGLRGREAVQGAAEEMQARLARAGISLKGFLLQPMAPPGIEMIVGVVHDPTFGPVVACGAGGVLVELLRDVSIRLVPVTEQDAQEMLAQLRIAPLLHGYRGMPARDVRALVNILVRVGALADDLPEIAELDLNPVLVHESGATIVDARIRVAPYERIPRITRRR